MRKSNQKCGTCRFFEPDDSATPYTGIMSISRPDTYGHCCCNSPHASRDVVQFPILRDTAWCGDYEAEYPTLVDDAAKQLARNVLAGDAQAAQALAYKLIELIQLEPLTGVAR